MREEPSLSLYLNGKHWYEGEMVTIKFNKGPRTSLYGNDEILSEIPKETLTITGRIYKLHKGFMDLDYSEKYESKTADIEYSDIISIKSEFKEEE